MALSKSLTRACWLQVDAWTGPGVCRSHKNNRPFRPIPSLFLLLCHEEATRSGLSYLPGAAPGEGSLVEPASDPE